jgi:steroid delta-isomerase-like uncharacterized protein
MQSKADPGGLQQCLDNYVEAWNTRDADRIASLFAEDGRYGEFGHGSVVCGRADIAEHLRAIIAALPDLQLTLAARPVCAGDRVFFRWTMRGRPNSAVAARLGLATPYELRGATVLVFKGGEITRAADSFEVRDSGGGPSAGLRSLSDGAPFSRGAIPREDPPEDNICYGE